MCVPRGTRLRTCTLVTLFIWRGAVSLSACRSCCQSVCLRVTPDTPWLCWAELMFQQTIRDAWCRWPAWHATVVLHLHLTTQGLLILFFKRPCARTCLLFRDIYEQKFSSGGGVCLSIGGYTHSYFLNILDLFKFEKLPIKKSVWYTCDDQR